MKFVFVLRNVATDTYGSPFVCSTVDEAVKSLVGSVQPDHAIKLMSQSALYCIGSFDSDAGCLKRDRKRLVASSLQLTIAARRSCENLAKFLDEMDANIAFIRSTLPKGDLEDEASCESVQT